MTAGGIWVSTFHSLCARLLRREAPAIRLSRDFVIYDSSDQLSVVKQAMKTLNIDDKLVPPRAALSRISQAKNRMESPEAMRSTGWSLRDQQISRVFEFYQRALTEASTRSISTTCCSRPSSSSKTSPVSASSTRASSSTSSSTNTRTRTGRSTCSFVVSPRSIATSASSAIRISRSTSGAARTSETSSISSSDFPDVHVVKLEQNYRSTQVILDAASAVIRRNRNRRDKRLWTDQRGGELIRYVRAADEIEEADFITRAIRETQRADRDRMVAVLYRTNAQSRAIEDALMRDGIPYRIIGGVRFYERKEIKDALVVSASRHQSARRCELPAGGERAGPRHRQDGDRGARSRRSRQPPTRTRRCLPPG